MTPAAIIALIKDIVIVIAIGAVIYVLVAYGKDIVKVADIAAVQKQIAANAQTVAGWRQEQVNAEAKHTEELAQVSAAIGAQRSPIILQSVTPKAGTCPVPGAAAGPAGPPAASGPVDIRPGINAFELKYETALADCRSALAQWPR